MPHVSLGVWTHVQDWKSAKCFALSKLTTIYTCYVSTTCHFPIRPHNPYTGTSGAGETLQERKKARYKESGMHAETSLWSGRQSADGIHCVCIVRKYDIGTFHHYRPTPRRRSPTHPICFILSTFSLESLANPDIPCLDFPLFSILMPLER